MFRKPVVPQGGFDSLPERPGRRTAGLLNHSTDRLVLAAHRLAVRLDWIPQEFATAHPVDESDPKAVTAEWRRLAKLWADYNGETLFALKAGALMLGVGLGAVLLLVAIL